MKRIVVIGGGISGIAAAYWAAASGFEVVLLEASDRLGGVLSTIHDGPYMVESSADNFATMIPDALELTKLCGLESEMIQPESENRQAFVVRGGELHPIPLGFSLMQPTRIRSMLATRTLSWSGKLRLLGEYWVKARESAADESLESFVTRRLGKEAYENLVEPIVSGIFTADPKTLSMQATMRQFVEMERKHGGLIRGALAARKQDAAAIAKKASGARYDQFVAPAKGMSDWIEKLAARLPSDCVRLQTLVESVHRPSGHSAADQGPWEIRLVGGQAAIGADAVILATPAPVTARLLSAELPVASNIVAAIPYASSAVAALIVKQSELSGRTDGFGVIVPKKEKRGCLAISYSSNKYPGRVPEGEILLRIFMGGALAPETVDLSDEQLLKIAEQELRDLLGWTGSSPNWARILRWRDAMPQYLVGHVQQMQQLSSELAQTPNLRLCGAAYDGVGIPQCVRGGKRAVEALRSHFEQLDSKST